MKLAALGLSIVAALSGVAGVASGAPALAGHQKTIHATGTDDAYSFAPQKATIKVGTRVIWLNDSDTTHSVTSTASKWPFDKTVDPGAHITFTFKKAGTYRYHCTFHPNQDGVIVVKS